uniref:Uncharacterized protein n=1 Tax=Cannabis sativa TaxID=3483 RepID=A0A803R4Z8_CANSA
MFGLAMFFPLEIIDSIQAPRGSEMWKNCDSFAKLLLWMILYMFFKLSDLVDLMAGNQPNQ